MTEWRSYSKMNIWEQHGKLEYKNKIMTFIEFNSRQEYLRCYTFNWNDVNTSRILGSIHKYRKPIYRTLNLSIIYEFHIGNTRFSGRTLEIIVRNWSNANNKELKRTCQVNRTEIVRFTPADDPKWLTLAGWYQSWFILGMMDEINPTRQSFIHQIVICVVAWSELLAEHFCKRLVPAQVCDAVDLYRKLRFTGERETGYFQRHLLIQ